MGAFLVKAEVRRAGDGYFARDTGAREVYATVEEALDAALELRQHWADALHVTPRTAPTLAQVKAQFETAHRVMVAEVDATPGLAVWIEEVVIATRPSAKPAAAPAPAAPHGCPACGHVFCNEEDEEDHVEECDAVREARMWRAMSDSERAKARAEARSQGGQFDLRKYIDERDRERSRW
jgi:hypothetical protein